MYLIIITSTYYNFAVIMYIDEASDDLEACRVLTTNAENLSSAISKALYHTQSASIRVPLEKREELGLTHVMQESDPITGKQSHHHRVSVTICCNS